MGGGGSENGKVPFLYVLKESLRRGWVVQKHPYVYDIWIVFEQSSGQFFGPVLT